ncbi:uncharacterized protein PODANS_2_70 [Podospora anserina S mat+]|uniref:Podospora anserina S mat+ genomic DNA chromosome 2, supercontig 2 n=1 Tax=Podospora anserina (strain S / ATCC MYA-4624 / DSM 980 / FGSC 10383) TaxID=515849 RepID=B2B451_PODAN|nr:uncharacterized protein PODANS_2_70 [Podospora anserina S mat+]CAP72575.1 unnamed protein product [Podospora anserina S mat+]CDP24970.1 Putative protein of unknown function [Podospora anserina S mat+]
MEPSSKRRRLAPKVADPPVLPPHAPASVPVPVPVPAPAPPHTQAQPPPHGFPQEQLPPPHYAPTETVAPPPERHEFEAFARHLQDAAMHIHQQTLKPQHTSVSVLMLRWEDDTSVEQDLLALEKVFIERYNYHTDKWAIPTVPNPSIKLGVQMASFLDNARPDHLLIIYYAGHGYVGSDNQLYWACNAREDAAKLKWDGVRCLFEDAQSEILLLLDSCAIPNAPMAGSNVAKQAIAAYTPEQTPFEPGPRSFTASLTDTLHKLSLTNRPFSAQRLFEDLRQQRQHESAQALARLANGASKQPVAHERIPALFTLTHTRGHGIILVPLDPKAAQLQSPPQSADTDLQGTWKSGRDDRPLSSEEVMGLTFDEPRVLVCTTFVGDASPDMAFFNQWLHNTPPAASKIKVEGMFLGPPTMLLISMPNSVWNVVQHDKVCCFLGSIGSHNMIHLYERLVNQAANGSLQPKELDENRTAFEARPPAKGSPSATRREQAVAQFVPIQQETPGRQADSRSQPAVVNGGAISAPPPAPQGQQPSAVPQEEVEESAEMKEAAEQLKALSHVRHVSDDGLSAHDPSNTRIGDSIAVRHAGDPGSPPVEVAGPTADEIQYAPEYGTPTAKSKARRPLQKQTPKQDTLCDLCSHAPFKDSSSLRKHVAAAHTRPFPCAFSFAGCPSTFGSKNEWKRHIASQHLCLQYYRCSSCPQSSPDGKGNEFNRKDLFTQHLRRMHAPFAIKKSIAKGDSKLQVEWETHVKEMQASCLVTRRQPPQRSACPKQDCQSVFEGPGSWDEWTEHVGRHMEKGEAQQMGVDSLLSDWALEEGIIERLEDGEYKLTSGNGNGNGVAERDSNGHGNGSGSSNSNTNNSFLVDGGKREDEDPSITVAITLPMADDMEVD